MGMLKVVFKIGLAHPFLLPESMPDLPATVRFPDTGNTVRIEPPSYGGPGLIGTMSPRTFNYLTLEVERECGDEQGKDTSYINNERLSINRDAGRAFSLLFETIREVEAHANYVAGYPVVPSEVIQSNPLVGDCTAEWIYDGGRIQGLKFGGVASIQIKHDTWAETVRRLAENVSVPGYRSFALDALYFATAGDPPRAIIMACAAWETALREYLGTVAAKKDKAYEVKATEKHSIPTLYGFVKIAKGHRLLHDAPKDRRKTVNKLINELPCLRNRLLHLGKRDLPEGKAVEHASAVLDAIEWLFRDA